MNFKAVSDSKFDLVCTFLILKILRYYDHDIHLIIVFLIILCVNNYLKIGI